MENRRLLLVGGAGHSAALAVMFAAGGKVYNHRDSSAGAIGPSPREKNKARRDYRLFYSSKRSWKEGAYRATYQPNGTKERERRQQQIENGQLTAANGLASA